MAKQALADIKVLDLSQDIAGPYCTKVLADHGADVIKVEPPAGDPTRRLGPFPKDEPHPEKSGFFLHLNTNKRGITLDLSTEAGQKVVKDLVKWADVLVESFDPGVMAAWGLSYDELSKINPHLIMTSITNFGQDGPYRDYVGSELTIFAMGGKMSSAGIPSREPLALPGNQVQCQAGNCAAMALMAAYYGRQYAEMGGQYIDISIYETQMASYNSRMGLLVQYIYTAERALRSTGATVGYPSGFYPCADGYVTIQGGMENWRKTAGLLGMPELVSHPRFSGVGQYDMEARVEFETTIWIPWLLERTMLEILETVQAAKVPCGMLSSVDDAVNNPHLNARGYFVEVEHAAAGTFKYLGAPFKTSGEWWQIRRPAPTLGQHNDEVMGGQLGYSQDDLAGLRQRSVI